MIQKLLKTSVFRLSLIYALLFSIVAASALGFIYGMAKTQMQQQTDARLQLETSALLNLYSYAAVEGLVPILGIRNSENGSRYLISRLIHRSQQDLTQDLRFDYYLQDDPRKLFATIPLGSITNEPDNQEPARMMLTMLPGGYQLLVVTDLKEQHTLTNRLLQTVLGASAVIFILAITGGALMAGNVQKRINAVGKAANELMEGDFSQRMPVTSRNDEFDRLSRVLNTMLERIETLMQSMRDVTDNLAHDLRNPLNRLRNRLESSQYQSHTAIDYPELVQETIIDLDELIKTFNALLSIAQAESGVQREGWQTVDISLLIEELAELYTVVAEEAEIHLSYATEANLAIRGNRQLLAQAITNLLDNAVKYTPKHGHIHLQAQQQGQQLIVSIADDGAGIPTEQHEQVFKRFIRLDNARSTPGNGLGLSLVKAVAELHHAEINLADNQPGLVATLSFATSAD